jgi:riboflavin biosynthesis pyrimidine reductase
MCPPSPTAGDRPPSPEAVPGPDPEASGAPAGGPSSGFVHRPEDDDPTALLRPFDAEAVLDEPRPAFGARPWVLANFVASIDGAATGPDGRSGTLSGAADRALFQALRAAADVVLAGAGTVRTENYGRARLTDAQQEHRRGQGRAALPRLAVVSASLRLDPAARFFAEALPDQPPIVLTTTAALTDIADRAEELAAVASVYAAGETTVDWGEALRVLHAEVGAGVVLAEGGPTVIGQLVTADLLDELCLTVSPLMAGGDAPRIVAGARIEAALPQRLDRVFAADGYLFLRYLRDRTAEGPTAPA